MFSAILISILSLPALILATPFTFNNDVQEPLGSVVDVKVPVELGVMSRCPDALLCENVFDQVVKKVADKIDISLIYVAQINTSEPDFGVTCMHGPEECAGNIQQLCTFKYAPAHWWEFVQCQNYQGRGHVGEPAVALKCAKVAGFDWDVSGVGSCAGLDESGQETEGVQLLQESVKLSKTLGIEKSCTVLINRQKVCVHDGTWKECEDGHGVNDFVKKINEEYELLNSNN